jgi:hypothetical protein
MLVQFATLPGAEDRPNEDFVGAFPDCAVLLDGAGGPAELPSGCAHGTAWYVRQLGARCLAGMETDHDRLLTRILAAAITDVGDLHRGTCDLDAPGTPASVVVMARAGDKAFEYLVLGDSTLAVDTGDAGIAIVSDRRIESVAADENRAMEALPTGSPEHQAARIRFVRRQREARNKPGGYWIASTDPDAAAHALTGNVPISDVRRAALLSDGVTRFVEFGLGTWGELLGILDTYGPSTVFSRIRAAEEADPDGSRWPRAKRRDDVGVVHFSRQGRGVHGEVPALAGRRAGHEMAPAGPPAAGAAVAFQHGGPG